MLKRLPEKTYFSRYDRERPCAAVGALELRDDTHAALPFLIVLRSMVWTLQSHGTRLGATGQRLGWS